MRLRSFRVRNFRCFQEETKFELSDFTALIGRNDVGKSAILDALALFFDEYKLDIDDASLHGSRSDVTVIGEFDELPGKVDIDAGYRTSATDEWMVNERGCLEIHRVFDGSLKTPKQTKVFLVANHPTADGFADLLYLKNAQLKARANELGVSLEHVDQRVNCALRKAIWTSAENLHLREQEIDISKEDAKKVWESLKRQLPLFAIFRSDRKSTDQDDEAQGPLKAAVEEALQTQTVQLDQVTAVVRDQVLSIARATVKKLQEMDPSLAKELNPRFTQSNWSKVFGISLTDDSQVPINKRGSGVRRLILLNFFRAQAEKRLADSDAPGIIYAIEEPETGQHPHNQDILFRALRDLAEQPGCQVIITTHTPVLVRNLPLESLKYIEQDAQGRRTILGAGDVSYRRISRALGVTPDHNVRLFIGVEGVNDIAFLCNMSRMLLNTGKDVLDLAELEEKGEIIFIPLGGSNLALWTHRLSHLNRYEYHIFDRDEQPPATSTHQPVANKINSRPNARAVLTGKREMENFLHSNAIRDAMGISVTVTDFCDVPGLVAEQIHASSGSKTPWNELDEDKKKKKISRAKKHLNNEVVLTMTPEWLSESDPDGEILKWLFEIRQLYESDDNVEFATPVG